LGKGIVDGEIDVNRDANDEHGNNGKQSEQDKFNYAHAGSWDLGMRAGGL
jgi:hypothetical protein